MNWKFATSSCRGLITRAFRPGRGFIIAKSLLALIIVLLTGCSGDIRRSDELLVNNSFIRSESMSKESALLDESKLSRNSNDIPLRMQLVFYYSSKRLEEAEYRKNYIEHIQWFIKNAPDSNILSINPVIMEIDGKLAFETTRELWKINMAKYIKRPDIFANAAMFFLYNGDLRMAVSLLKHSIQLDPSYPEWHRRIGGAYREIGTNEIANNNKSDAINAALMEYRLVYKLTKGDQNKYYAMGDYCRAAYNAGEYIEAEYCSTNLLKAAFNYRDDWNYGNAIHYGNIIIGNIRLRNGDVVSARKHLIAAGNTPGSPQLRALGPDFSLAKRLLLAGDKKTVLKYLKLCSVFWRKEEKIQYWMRQINKGQIPDFNTVR